MMVRRRAMKPWLPDSLPELAKKPTQCAARLDLASCLRALCARLAACVRLSPPALDLVSLALADTPTSPVTPVCLCVWGCFLLAQLHRQ